MTAENAENAENLQTILVRVRPLFGWWPLLLAGSAIAFYACAGDNLPEPSRAQRVDPECPPSVSLDYFFPTLEIDPSNDIVDANIKDYSSALLRAVKASSLSCGSAPDEAYRLIFQPSGGHDPHTVILVMKQRRSSRDEWTVEADELIRARMLESWKVVGHSRRLASETEIDALHAALVRAQFWTAVQYYNSQIDDGFAWMIEGRRQTGYRALYRANPRKQEEIDIGLQFFSIAGLPLPDVVRTDATALSPSM